MAATAIASKVGTLANVSKGVSGSSKFLAAAALNNKVPSANIYSKSSGNIQPRMKPWDYKRFGFSYLLSLVDGTTKRFNDNSKLLVVEGPPAIGKTEFAKAVADELDMKFVPGFTMDDFYINAYGYDLRDLDYKVEHERVKTYDEKKFAQDPTGQSGGLDRMLMNMHLQRYIQHMEILEHIFNTGEGVVTERSPHSDWIYMDAAFNQGWICKTTRAHYHKIRSMTIDMLLRPNLIIHLDAPMDVVQSKIRERSKTTHPWEASSPVWENTDYLHELYNVMMKKKYLTEAAEHSMVLSYDWSEGGDFEVVIEDIERLNMDYHDKYDKQQKDWRLLTEERFATKRWQFTHKEKLFNQFRDPFWSADKLILTSVEAEELAHIQLELPGNFYRHGYNTVLGDPEPFFSFGWGKARQMVYNDTKYQVNNTLSHFDIEHDDRQKLSRKAAGDPNWWKL